MAKREGEIKEETVREAGGYGRQKDMETESEERTQQTRQKLSYVMQYLY